MARPGLVTWNILQSLIFAAAASPPAFSALIMADWGGHGTPPFTTPGEIATSSGMATLVNAWQGRPVLVLALGDNFYADGLCNNATLAPYNNSCPTRFDPRSGTIDDPRFNETFESVFSAPELASIPFAIVAGNQDALGNVSASIAYTSRSQRWRHPDYYYRVTTQPAAAGLRASHAVEHFPHELPGNTSLDSKWPRGKLQIWFTHPVFLLQSSSSTRRCAMVSGQTRSTTPCAQRS